MNLQFLLLQFFNFSRLQFYPNTTSGPIDIKIGIVLNSRAGRKNCQSTKNSKNRRTFVLDNNNHLRAMTSPHKAKPLKEAKATLRLPFESGLYTGRQNKTRWILKEKATWTIWQDIPKVNSNRKSIRVQFTLWKLKLNIDFPNWPRGFLFNHKFRGLINSNSGSYHVLRSCQHHSNKWSHMITENIH